MFIFYFKILFIYFYREGKGERKRGREILMCGCLSHAPQLGVWPATQACALTGNRTCDPLLWSPVLNPLGHTSQGERENPPDTVIRNEGCCMDAVDLSKGRKKLLWCRDKAHDPKEIVHSTLLNCGWQYFRVFKVKEWVKVMSDFFFLNL